MKKNKSVFWKDCPRCLTLGGMHLDIQKKKWICDVCGYEEDEEKLRLDAENFGRRIRRNCP